MIRRSVKIAAEGIALLVAGTLVITVAVLWRLKSGPVETDFLTPYIVKALDNALPGQTVHIGSSELVWTDLDDTFDLHLKDFALGGKPDAPLAHVDRLSLRFSIRTLFSGRLEPVEVALHGPSLMITRDTDGVFHLDVIEPDTSAGDRSLTNDLILGFAGPDAGPIGAIERLSVEGARFLIADHMLGFAWDEITGDILLIRRKGGITGNASLNVPLYGTTARLDLNLNHDFISGPGVLQLDLSGVRPALLARKFPALAQGLAGLDTEISAKTTIAYDSSMTVETVPFSIKADAGRLTLPGMLREPLDFTRLAIDGRYRHDTGRLNLDESVLDLGGPILGLAGEAIRKDDAIRVDMEVYAGNIPVAD
ncbi:MAG: hypothetical protein U9N14_04705, partial [Pseudomonadota bacterium]|nr:hypothetical protein [Pseudomonadota bacterium]